MSTLKFFTIKVFIVSQLETKLSWNLANRRRGHLRIFSFLIYCTEMNLIKGGSIAEKFCVEKSFPSNGESSKFEYVADLNGTESRQMMSSNDNTSPPNLA